MKRIEGWGFSAVVPLPALQTQGPKFDPEYQKKKIYSLFRNCNKIQEAG